MPEAVNSLDGLRSFSRLEMETIYVLSKCWTRSDYVVSRSQIDVKDHCTKYTVKHLTDQTGERCGQKDLN